MRTLLLGLACWTTAVSAASAQARRGVPADSLPTCASRGVTRVGVMQHPGQSADSLRRALGASLPAGARVEFFPAAYRPALRNLPEVRESVGRHMREFAAKGWKFSGEVRTMLRVDETGRVTEARVTADHDSIQAGLREFWTRARFAPLAFGGCRAPVWIHAPLRFTTVDNQMRVEYERVQ